MKALKYNTTTHVKGKQNKFKHKTHPIKNKVGFFFINLLNLSSQEHHVTQQECKENLTQQL